MKKILIYLNTLNASGGIERVVCNLLQIWASDYKIIVLTKDRVGASYYKIPDSIKWESLYTPLFLDMKDRKQRIFAVGRNSLLSIIKLRKKIRDIEPDYIYTTTPLNSLEIYLADIKWSKKIVISEHASVYAVNSVYQKIKQFIYPKVYLISVPNKMDCKEYEKWGCNVVYIPHPNTFIPKYRNKLDTKIALNIGRYTSDKRQDVLIKCWSRVKNRNGWQLWIVGEGEERDNLLKLIHELKLSGSVFLKAATKDIEDVYREASLFVFTSRMEGFGMVLLEAMSYGIPCISFDCPSGPRDIIKEGQNGNLVKNGMIYELVTSIEKYINTVPFKRDEMGKMAFETASEWGKNISAEWEKVFV